jgi:hypothetical protein
MSSDPGSVAAPRRLALVVASFSAATGAPPGIDPQAFASACLADTYEVLADLDGVSSGIIGSGSEVSDLLWPGSVLLHPTQLLRDAVTTDPKTWDEVVFVPADVPDLPGLVIAKLFKALQHADVCLAPERGGGGLVAFAARWPWPSWAEIELDLDVNPSAELAERAPRRSRLATGPSWHRMRTPASVNRLDPGLEGWEQTRALLSGHTLSSG